MNHLICVFHIIFVLTICEMTTSLGDQLSLIQQVKGGGGSGDNKKATTKPQGPQDGVGTASKLGLLSRTGSQKFGNEYATPGGSKQGEKGATGNGKPQLASTTSFADSPHSMKFGWIARDGGSALLQQFAQADSRRKPEGATDSGGQSSPKAADAVASSPSSPVPSGAVATNTKSPEASSTANASPKPPVSADESTSPKPVASETSPSSTSSTTDGAKPGGQSAGTSPPQPPESSKSEDFESADNDGGDGGNKDGGSGGGREDNEKTTNTKDEPGTGKKDSKSKPQGDPQTTNEPEDDEQKRETKAPDNDQGRKSPPSSERTPSFPPGRYPGLDAYRDGKLPPSSSPAGSPGASPLKSWSKVKTSSPVAPGDNAKPPEKPKPSNIETVTGNKVYNQGANYAVEFNNEGTGDQCKQKITVQGQHGMKTGDIVDTFQTSCGDKPPRTIYYADDTVMVGGVNQDILVYGQQSFPDKLIVFKDGVGSVKSYSKSGVDTKELTKEDADKVKQLMNGIQVEYILPSSQRQLDVVKDDQRQLDELMKTMSPGSTKGAQASKPEGVFASLASLQGLFCCS